VVASLRLDLPGGICSLFDEAVFMTQTNSKPTTDSNPEDLPSLLLPNEVEILEDGLKSEILSSFPTSTKIETDRSPWQRLKGLFWDERDLRDKAAIIGLLMGLIPISVITASTYAVAIQIMERQVNDKIALEATSLTDQLEMFISARKGELLALAQQDSFKDVQIRQMVSRPAQDKALNTFLENNPYYENIAVFDVQGRLIAQSKGQVNNEANEDYFRKVLKTQKPFIGEPRFDKTVDSSNFIIAVPVPDRLTGKTIAVLRGRIPLKLLDQQFAATTERGQQFYYFIDSEGNIAASNNNKDISSPVGEKFPQVNRLLTQGKQSNATVLESQQGKDTLVAYQRAQNLQEQQQVNWVVAVTQPEDQAFADSRWLGFIPLLGLLMAGGVGASAWLLANRATRPIRSLAKAVRRIGAGDLDSPVEIKGEDEFAILGANINAMAGQLKSLVAEQNLSVEMANTLADIGAIRLENAQRIDTTDSRAGEDDVMTILFKNSLARVRKSLSAQRVVIYRFNADNSGRVFYESLESGWGSALRESFSDPCIPKVLLDDYIQGRVQSFDDIMSADLHPDHRQLMIRLQVRANLIIPIRALGSLYGLFIVHRCDGPHNWSNKEIAFCQRIGDQFSTTLERFKTQISRRDDTRRAQLLKDITLKISAALDSDNVFEQAVKEARRGLGSDRVVVYRFNPDWSGTIITESVDSRFPVAKGATIADPCFADRYVEKYKRGRVHATSNIYEAGLTECHIRELEPFAVRANLVAPILNNGELLGLFIAHQCGSFRDWQQAEIDFMAQVATQVGLAIERTDLIKKQRQAEEEQREAREQLQKRALELLMEVDPVSRGDLTIRASVTEDEIGTIADSYNATIESLRKIVTQVQNAAMQVAGTTNYNEASVRALSQDASLQARDIAEALTRIQAMTNSIQAVATNAEQAEAAVVQATRTVEAGETAMNRTVDGIMAIRETVAETAKKVKRLGESSQKISKVVNLIGSFADQTNLLALNASIEAAHAGEEGRGFAVVAEEVRSLARQSANATAEIEALVASIQAETNEVVAAMESGTEQVVLGTKLVDETRKSLNQITAVSMQINELVEAIAKAAVEQSQTSQAVTRTMAQVAAVSDKTSSEASQVSDSFKELLEVALNLQESVRKFKVK
jgi:methyl-accepting chemotaxis protein PixJ